MGQLAGTQRKGDNALGNIDTERLADRQTIALPCLAVAEDLGALVDTHAKQKRRICLLPLRSTKKDINPECCLKPTRGPLRLVSNLKSSSAPSQTCPL